MGLILIIDDEKPLRDILRHALQTIGHTVIDAGQGRKGLELFDKFSPDLVITDIIMPDQTGIEVVATLKNKNKTLPIIVMSGGGRTRMLDFLEIAGKAGATKILTKPFRNEELLAAVDSLIGRPPAKAALP